MKSLLEKIQDAILRNRPRSGRNIKATQTADGVKLDFVPDEESKDGGGGGGDSLHRVKISGVHPQSPTGGSAKYIMLGDLYDNAEGFEGSVSESGVTVIPGHLADGEYPSTTLRDVCAVKRTATWTNIVGNPVTETVYEINVPRFS
ncbi:MAG: hypothetical protein KKB31_07260 [Nanoarchaeota archaeon]|nr:hypothetical protein [Nanoarchaeota archaeon]